MRLLMCHPEHFEVGLEVSLMPPPPGLLDMMFTGNAGMVNYLRHLLGNPLAVWTE